MKKLLIVFSTTVLLMLGLFSVSASAARHTQLPITMYESHNYRESLFTMTDMDIYVYSNEEPLYTNSAEFSIYGELNKGTQFTFSIYCYDASGNFLKSFTQELDYDFFDEYGYDWFTIDIPDVTASIEIGTAYPGSWSNTYFYNKYTNVYSDDGRALGISELLVPAYEKCGWHGPVWMYSLDDRSIEVPYNQIAAYKAVGWYLWDDYCYADFLNDYNYYLSIGDYSSAFDELDYAIYELSGTYYEQELYNRKTRLMDAWRKSANCPLAISYDYIDDEGDAVIYFRNVSYKTVKALKLDFDCYDIFGTKLSEYYDYYYCNDMWLESGEEDWISWDGIPGDTEYIKNIRITQVVYSDNTSWYR